LSPLWKVLLALLLITTTEGGLNTIYPPFLQNARYSVEQIGLFVALFGVLQLASRLPAGALYAAGRARPLFVGFVLLFMLSTIGFAYSDSVPLVLIMTMLHGFAFGGIGTVMLAWVIELKPAKSSHGATMGWYTAALSAGYSLGNFSGGFLADHWSYGISFLVLGLAPAMSVILGLTLPVVSRPNPPEEARPAGRLSTRARLANIRAIITPNLALATLIAFYLNFLDDGFATFFPLLGLSIGLSLTFIGLLKSFKSLTATILRSFAGVVFRYVHFKTLNNVLLIVWALAVFLVPTLREPWAFVTLFIIIGVCRALTRVTSATMLAEEKANDRQGIGLASGLYNAGLDVGSFVGPLVSGLIASATDIPTMFRITPLALLVVYFAAVLWVTRAARPVPAMAKSEANVRQEGN
jgi:MFS family permease